MAATWGLVTKGVLYAMIDDKYESKLTLGVTKDGDLIVPKQPFNVIVDINGTAPTPNPMIAPDAISLDVVFWPQTDNYREPNRTCFSSSMAMIVKRLNPGGISTDDQYLKCVCGIGDTTDPTAQTNALNKFGIEGSYSQTLDFNVLDKELALGYAVGIGILHRGPLNAPTGGHWIVCRGHNGDKSIYYFNDPYGSLGDGYQGKVENGKNVGYSRDVLKARWTAEGKNSGWGMICRKKA